MKTTLLATLLATSALLPACAVEDGGPDELADETELDGEAGKGDSVDAFTYFLLTPDTRACSFDADCGGFFVTRPNRAKTTCVDGDSSSRCYVQSLDWTANAALASAQNLETKLRDGVPILLRGTLGDDTGPRAVAKLTSDLAPLLASAQPMIDVGQGPDCLYAKLTVTGVTFGSASISVTPSTGSSSALRAEYRDVTITGSSAHAAACVDGTAPVSIKLARVEITGSLTGAARALENPAVEAEGLVVTAPQMPSVIRDLLDLETRAEGIVAQTTALAVAAVPATAVKPNLSVSEVWLPGSATAEADGVFVLAKDNGVRCITAPCPSTVEMRLNSNVSAAIHAVDLEAAGASAEAVEAASGDIATRTGVIIAGDRYYTNNGRAKGRRATQFWTRAR